MTRNHKSARAAGARFERVIANYLAKALNDDRIDRAPKHGAKDRGDIAGVNIRGHKIAIECKDTSRLELPEWANQAHREADNLGAVAGIIVHKRRGVSAPDQQWVTMTTRDLAAIIRESNYPWTF